MWKTLRAKTSRHRMIAPLLTESHGWGWRSAVQSHDLGTHPSAAHSASSPTNTYSVHMRIDECRLALTWG